MDQNLSVFTIGHSTLSFDKFAGILKAREIELIADVRSFPYSRRSPHFNREELAERLDDQNISYVFLGDLLGGRPRGRRFYCEGVADYEKMSRTKTFDEGLNCVLTAAEHRRTALMCSEHSPLDCHRCLLVGRSLADRFVQVEHILQDGQLTSQPEVEEELIKRYLQTKGLFDQPQDNILASAYQARSKAVAYREPMSVRSVAAE